MGFLDQLPKWKNLLLSAIMVIVVITGMNSCIKKNDPEPTMFLLLLYLIRSQPTISCWYTGASGSNVCLQNPSNPEGLGTLCQFTPFLDGARVVHNSSQTCEAQGYETCITITATTGSTYERCI